jgi:hypothetical protein
MALLEHVRVIVRELFTGGDVANCIYPDSPVIDDGVAIRIARVVDEPRFVSVKGGIDYDVVVDGKEIRMMPLLYSVGISLVCLSGRQSLAGVFDNARAGSDRADCERTESLYWRIAYFERNFRKNDYRCILQFLIPVLA